MDIATRGNTDSSFVIFHKCDAGQYHAGSTNSWYEYTLFDKMGAKPAGTDTKPYWEMPRNDNDPAMVESGTGKLFVVTTPENWGLVSFFIFELQGLRWQRGHGWQSFRRRIFAMGQSKFPDPNRSCFIGSTR